GDPQPRQLRRHVPRRVGRDGRAAGGARRRRPQVRHGSPPRPSTRDRSHRRPHNRFLPPLPALKQLIPRLIAIAVLAVVYLGLTLAVALGWLDGPDHTVAQQLDTAWRPALEAPFHAIAELGGIELTTLLAAGLIVLLYRRGFRSEAWGVAVAFVAAQAFEVFYKAQLFHPAPPPRRPHGARPRLTD